MVGCPAFAHAPAWRWDAGGGKGVGTIPTFDPRPTHRRGPRRPLLRTDRAAPAGGWHAGRRGVEIGPAAGRQGRARAGLTALPWPDGRREPNPGGPGLRRPGSRRRPARPSGPVVAARLPPRRSAGG